MLGFFVILIQKSIWIWISAAFKLNKIVWDTQNYIITILFTFKWKIKNGVYLILQLL